MATTSAKKRLSKILSWVNPKDGDDHTNQSKTTTTENLPVFDELPMFKNMPGCAWDVWGKDDQLGTVNLLTPDVVKRAAGEEIIKGLSVSLNWPVNLPSKPMFNRKVPEITMKPKGPSAIRDDELHINTQSGTQWDGLRHFGILEHEVFYQNTPKDSMPTGMIPIPDPASADANLVKIGIQNWATHGICGRGVLLDLVRFYTSSSGSELPYDPWTTHPITVAELQSCAKKQGVQFRTGDILLIRVGFIQKYMASSIPDREALGNKPETFAGIEQSEEMKKFLWNNHFAAIASDQPALERWPTPEGIPHLHQTLIGLWGMPIGEMFDLERLSDVCAETNRYTFFFTSWPLNILGGCASPPNAAAYF